MTERHCQSFTSTPVPSFIENVSSLPLMLSQHQHQHQHQQQHQHKQQQQQQQQPPMMTNLQEEQQQRQHHQFEYGAPALDTSETLPYSPSSLS